MSEVTEEIVVVPDRALKHVSMSRVGDEIWLEFYKQGLRVRFELTAAEAKEIIHVGQQLVYDIENNSIENSMFLEKGPESNE